MLFFFFFAPQCTVPSVDHDSDASTPCQTCSAGTEILSEGLIGPCANFACAAGFYDHDGLVIFF